MTPSFSSPMDPLIDPNADQPKFWPLRRFSDFLFLAHSFLCRGAEGCLPRLEWIVHSFVVNEETIDVVDQLMGNPPNGTEPDDDPDEQDMKWPGKSFPITVATPDIIDQASVATVGCPNGYGNAFLLSQHLQEYGYKTIDSVNIFADDQEELAVAWHINNLDDEFKRSRAKS